MQEGKRGKSLVVSMHAPEKAATKCIEVQIVESQVALPSVNKQPSDIGLRWAPTVKILDEITKGFHFRKGSGCSSLTESCLG